MDRGGDIATSDADDFLVTTGNPANESDALQRAFNTCF